MRVAVFAGALLTAAAAALAASGVSRVEAARDAPPAPAREVNEGFSFAVSWQQLKQGPVTRTAPSSIAFAPGTNPGGAPFFHVLSVTFTREDSDEALDSTGDVGPCVGSNFTPTTCSQIRVSALVGLTNPLGAALLTKQPARWCLVAASATGGIDSLRGRATCDSWVSIYWPFAQPRAVGGALLFELEDVTWPRQDFVLEHTRSITLRLGAGAAAPPCPRVPAGGGAGTVPKLDPGLGIYDALRQLSPKDERWDQLLRRIERQRTQLRRHLPVLERTARHIVYIYVAAHLIPVAIVVAAPIVKAVGLRLFGSQAARCALTPGAREAIIVRNISLMNQLLARQAAVLRIISRAGPNPSFVSPALRQAVVALERQLAQLRFLAGS